MAGDSFNGKNMYKAMVTNQSTEHLRADQSFRDGYSMVSNRSSVVPEELPSIFKNRHPSLPATSRQSTHSRQSSLHVNPSFTIKKRSLEQGLKNLQNVQKPYTSVPNSSSSEHKNLTSVLEKKPSSNQVHRQNLKDQIIKEAEPHKKTKKREISPFGQKFTKQRSFVVAKTDSKSSPKQQFIKATAFDTPPRLGSK